MGPNFEFKYMRFQLAFAEPFLVFVNFAANLANPANFSADFFVNFKSSVRF